MILTNFKLTGFQRARCWVDEFPKIPRLTSVTQVNWIEDVYGGVARNRQIAIEWVVPRGVSFYGLLGAELRPAETGFKIELASTNKLLDHFEDAIASKASEEVRCGLLEEYVPAVLEGMNQATKQLGLLPRGGVVCNIAACGMVGSNAAIFKALGNAVLRLLITEEKLNEETVGAFLRLE